MTGATTNASRLDRCRWSFGRLAGAGVPAGAEALDLLHARDPPRRGFHALDVPLPLQAPAQEDHAVLGVDDHLSLWHAPAAVQLALDLLCERHVVERLTAPEAARIEGPSRDPDRVRFRPPRARQSAALAARARDRTRSGRVTTAPAGLGVEEERKIARARCAAAAAAAAGARPKREEGQPLGGRGEREARASGRDGGA